MEHQDWTPVQMKRAAPKPSPVKTTAAQAAVHNARLDGDDFKVKRRRLIAESRHALAAARIAMKKSQRDVDKELAFPPNTIRDYEFGASAPNGTQIGVLQRYFAAAHLVLKVETV